MSVFLADPDVTLYQGHTLDVLRGLPDASVDCCVTSPPYYGLRDYGVPGQIGLEASPDEHVAALVEVFREVRRVLADHATCWVNYGDAFTSGNSGQRITGMNERFGFAVGDEKQGQGDTRRAASTQLPAKNLLGMPWRLAFALQADGWILRSDVVWSKPNPMPESVTDRPTRSHEYVFLLAKRPRYWYDADAIREPQTIDRDMTRVVGQDGSLQHRDGERWPNPAGRNARSVWQIATQPTPEAHFATYPQELVRRCLLAGCAGEVCRECGEPRRRIVETTYTKHRPSGGTRSRDERGNKAAPETNWGTFGTNLRKQNETLGWSDCGHAAYRPGVVLDPFIGSGTTALVARHHARHAIGIDLNSDYLAIAARRLQQLSLLAEEATA